MKLKSVILPGAMLLSMIWYSCSDNTSQSLSETESSETIKISPEQFGSSNMKLGTLEKQVLKNEIRTTGYLDVPPGNKALISPSYGGFVKSFDLLEGQKVKKGSLLFRLENMDFIQMQQEYLEAKKQLEYLKSDYERQEILANENVASKKNYLKAKTDYDITKAKYLGLKEKLILLNIRPVDVENGNITSSINVYSPISGFVSEITIAKGAFLNPADIAMKITNTEHMHLELQVFEKDVLKIHEDQKITYRIPGVSSQSFEGTVHLVGQSINEKDRTINVHGHISEDRSLNYMPGMFVEADIIAGEDSLYCLPASSVIETGSNAVVLTLLNKTDAEYEFVKTEVRTGTKSEQWIEIKNAEDLNGKSVLIEGGFQLIQE